jgi:hypothetical protein
MIKMRLAGRTFCLAALRLVLFPFTPFGLSASFGTFSFLSLPRDIFVAQFRLNDEDFFSS